ncbi:hypothetical protein [Pseudomonas salomonii]|uniref:Uncharacterized protein n=1 Tax=Pseudomonas salomonii TaxID=191391 RepID=A0A1H3KF14_9PSED|nr:hypothetical protein [Pseudomonas salomonii]SDY50405.1 hypothetical protein SAMN05216247_10468 [Pseudomonas salomonii]
MQNELKSAIRFNDFVAYFGPRGVVAMAWWLGAIHAAQIRKDHNSFPFIQINGAADRGKSLILDYLQKLTGQVPYAYSLAYPTPAARARSVLSAENRVVICENEGEFNQKFDWDELKPLYNGEFSIRSEGVMAEHHTFKGALTITANHPVQCSDAVASRMVTINFSDESPHATRVRPEAITDVSADKAIAFGIKVAQSEDWVTSSLERLLPRYQGQLTQTYGDGLSPRTAKNCAQMLALLDLLCTLLSIPDALRNEAVKVMHDIASESIPF